MSRLKDSLDSAKKGVSITIPASYWYLQHFDLKALSKTVSWFNVMSYDLHGTWDKGNQWTGNFLNAHNNLTEIKDALDLIWRNEISPSQVVMGVGFYGRAFTASSASCLEPGCTFESGAERGACSREVGILLNSEIDDLVKKNGVKPKLYKEETVKVAAWGDQWVAYDDEETFRLKSEFAQTQCLGGLMVWAISHDTKDAKYNQAFAKAVNRKITSLPMTDGSDEAFKFVDIQNEQCKWTNCGAPCPSGWVLMKREDKGARKGEFMFDETGCNGKGSHAFCCPPSDKLPSCGWYNHHNGRCKAECPDGMGHVGGNSMYCNNGGYQAACCTQGVRPIKLYAKCQLGPWPWCDQQTGCPGSQTEKNTLLAASGSGMGGSICLATGVKNGPYGIGPGGTRKLCCDASNPKETFSNCEWYDYSGHDWKIKGHCDNNCPDDKVRVALDTIADGCKTGGKARCCSPNYFDTIEVENPKLDDYRSEVEKYLKDPTCSNPGSILSKRGAQVERPLVDRRSASAAATAISRRATSPGQSKTQEMCLELLSLVGTSTMLEALEMIWNESVGKKFPNLKVSNLRQTVKKMPEYETSGPIQVCHDITCSPYSWNNRLGGGGGGGGTRQIDCTTGFCALRLPEDAEECEGATQLRRRHTDSYMSYPEALVTTPTAIGLKHGPVSVLVKRAREPYRTTVRSPDGSEEYTVVTNLPEYFGFSQLDGNNPIFDEMVDYESVDDCGNLRLTHVALPIGGNNGRWYHMEHIFDGNLIGQFMADAAAGRLRSGATAQSGPVSISFFRQVRMMPLPLPPPIPGGFNPPRLLDRVMECLGSQDNTAFFVGALEDINAAKTALMQGHNPIREDRWVKEASNPNRASYVLNKLKASIGVIYYLNRQTTPNVNGRLTTIVNNVGIQWEYGQLQWNQNNPRDQIAILQIWRDWNRDFFDTFLINHTRNFVQNVIDVMRKYWGVMTGDEADQVLETLRVMENAINNSLFINTANFDD